MMNKRMNPFNGNGGHNCDINKKTKGGEKWEKKNVALLFLT